MNQFNQNTISETKDQWARDDPAFIVVQGIFVAVNY
jgi:hypothetical protein